MLLIMEDRKYATDLSDDEWDCVRPHLYGPKGRGRPKVHGSRAILDAVFFFVLKRAAAPGGYCAPGIPALEDRIRLVQEMAHRWNLRAAQRRAARATADPFG